MPLTSSCWYSCSTPWRFISKWPRAPWCGLYRHSGHFRVRESEAWKQHRATSLRAIVRTAGEHWRIFLYLVLFMTLMMFLSHGTQDLYPDLLKSARSFDPKVVAYLVMLLNVGAVLGAVIFRQLSESRGRRRTMILALLLSMTVIPAWTFGGSLNELSPDAVRGLVPGFTYQLGILIAAPVNNVVYALRRPLGYAWALAAFEIVNIALLITVVALGSERKDPHDADLTL
jgi:SHS family lactate transporter-like MFS transporter